MNKIFFSPGFQIRWICVWYQFTDNMYLLFFSLDWAQQISSPLSLTTYIVSVNSIRDKLMIVTILIRYKSWQSEIKFFSIFFLLGSFNFILFHFLYSLGAFFRFSHYAHKLRWNLSFILHTSTSRWVFGKYFFIYLLGKFMLHMSEVACNIFFCTDILFYMDTTTIYISSSWEIFSRSRVCCWIHLKTFSIVAETFF